MLVFAYCLGVVYVVIVLLMRCYYREVFDMLGLFFICVGYLVV